MKQSYFSFWMNPGAVLWLIILVLAAWGQAEPLTGQIRERILYSALRKAHQHGPLSFFMTPQPQSQDA